MNFSMMNRLRGGSTVLVNSVARPASVPHRCPFLKAAQSISGPSIPVLYQQFKSMCPFLQSSAHAQLEVDKVMQEKNLPDDVPDFQSSLMDHEPGFQIKEPIKATPKIVHRDANVVVEEKLTQLKKEGNYRTFFDVERKAGQYPKALRHDAKLAVPDEVITFCSNDYLSMGQNPVVLDAMTKVLEENGAGAGGTRNISGTTPHHSALERELADLHSKESALVFTSCFVANDSSISTLGKMLPGCEIYSDADNHSSLIEGIRHSGCKKHIFRHNDVAHLKEKLAASDPTSPKIIVFESVYSMDGDIAPIKEICDLADEYNALTFLDEVHAVGLYGATGAGIAQQRALEHRISFISGTLAKGYGVFGGYIAGNSLMVDAVRSFAPGFIFTSSLPPAIAAGATASIRYLKESSVEREQHQERAASLKDMLKAANLPYIHSESHIVPVMVCNAELCKKASDMLLNKHKIYVQPINYPTVAKGSERLRFTPGPMHTQEMLDDLVAGLNDVWDTLGLQRAS